MAFPESGNGAGQATQPQRGIQTAPLHGAPPPDGVRAQLCASALPARREASVPAGQSKNTAHSRSAAGKSATLENPAHFQRAVRTALRPCTMRSSPTGRDAEGGSVKGAREDGVAELSAVRACPQVSGLSKNNCRQIDWESLTVNHVIYLPR